MSNACEWGTCDSPATTTVTVNHDDGKGYVTESYCPECADMRQRELEDREYGFREGLGFFAPSMVLCESGEIDGGTRCDEEHLYHVWHVPACHRSTATTAGTARGVSVRLPICSGCYEGILDEWTWDADEGDEAPALCEDDDSDEDDTADYNALVALAAANGGKIVIAAGAFGAEEVLGYWLNGEIFLASEAADAIEALADHYSGRSK